MYHVSRRAVAGSCSPIRSAEVPTCRFKRATDARLDEAGCIWICTRDRDAEVARLIGLGAKRYPWRSRPNADFTVLEDPDGNLFCVVQKNETG